MPRSALRLRRNYEKSRIADELEYPFVLCALACIAIAFISIVSTWLTVIERDKSDATAHAAQTSIEEVLNASPDRQTLARTLLQQRELGLETAITPAGSNGQTDTVITALERTAATGEEVTINTDTYYFEWKVFWRRVITFFFCTLSLLLFASYTIMTVKNRHYLSDLQFDEFSVFLVSVTFVGWPAYIVSAIRLVRARNQRAEASDQRAEVSDRAENQTHTIRRVDFPHAPIASRACYHALRESATDEYRTRRASQARSELDSEKRHARELGEAIKDCQARIGELSATLKEAELIAEQEAVQLSVDQLDHEFDRLMALPGVKGARVINDALSLHVEAHISYQDILYDIGEWELRVSQQMLTTRLLRTGVKDDWLRGEYPDYRFGGGEFCFGSRDHDISENIRKGQILEAVELAVNCMRSVNPEDEYRIPRAFHTVSTTKG